MGRSVPRFGTRVPILIQIDGIRNAVAAQVTRAEKRRSTCSREISREWLWTLSTHGGRRDVYVRADLVTYGDAVEVELLGGSTVISRFRFVRDAAARLYGARARHELEQQGYSPGWLERPEEYWSPRATVRSRTPLFPHQLLNRPGDTSDRQRSGLLLLPRRSEPVV